MTRLALSSLFASLVLTTVATATAQPASSPPPPPPDYGYAPPPPPPPPSFGVVDRKGFIIGFSLGGGSFSSAECNNCDSLSGVGLDIHLGGMLTPRLALMFDGSGVAHTEENGSVIHIIDTVAAQYWVTPRVWLKGGLGIGRLSVNDRDGNEIAASETGTGALFAAGVELVQSRTFALDLQLRASAVSYDNVDTISMTSLTVGVNWY